VKSLEARLDHGRATSTRGAARLAFGGMNMSAGISKSVETGGLGEPAMVDGHNGVESTPRIKKECKGYHYQSTGTSRQFLCFRFPYDAL